MDARVAFAKEPPVVLTEREPIVIRSVEPEIDAGRWPVKREIGDWLVVEAEIFREGHARLDAVLHVRGPGETQWRESPMRPTENDRWSGSCPLDAVGRWHYAIEAWTDRWGSWRADLATKVEAGASQASLDLDLREGRALIAGTIERLGHTHADDCAALRSAHASFALAAIGDEALDELMRRHADRSRAVSYGIAVPVAVDRVRARFAAWYELFPRSQSLRPNVHGTFDDVCRRIPEIASWGFDVVYLPPIHPIGERFRKGRDNALEAAAGDVGSPWAIGSSAGGHTSVHPELGTLDDFRALVGTTKAHGMEIALDFALQCAPDHPWIQEHPQWFSFRADGSIRYAENPPKKYQDIVPFNFDSPDAPALWAALRDVVLFWVEQGVETFRVDNPHTKPIPFWAWLIRQVQDLRPGVVFLAEAFTRPAVMQELARVGFTQSYTYFTWRNTKEELTQYVTELSTETNEFLRPNFFANTPDILPEILQRGGRPAFRSRLILAATLSSLYGMYSGFELCENDAVPETQEYRHSEKYELRARDWSGPESILDDVRAINRIRRENAALQEFENVRFYPSNDEDVIFYGKTDFFHRNHVFVAVNLDPYAPHTPALEFPTGEFGIDPSALTDAFGKTRLEWMQGRASTTLDPQHNPFALFAFNR